jgi:hypothetical protein
VKDGFLFVEKDPYFALDNSFAHFNPLRDHLSRRGRSSLQRSACLEQRGLPPDPTKMVVHNALAFVWQRIRNTSSLWKQEGNEGQSQATSLMR